MSIERYNVEKVKSLDPDQDPDSESGFQIRNTIIFLKNMNRKFTFLP